MTTQQSPQFNIMDTTCRRLAPVFRRHFIDVERMQVKEDGPGSFVADVKQELTQIMGEELSKTNAKILLPDSTYEDLPQDAPCWMINPLVGGENFAHGREPAGCRMVYVKNGTPISGMAYFPLPEKTFFAEKGTGAVGDGKRLRIAGRKSPQNALMQVFIGPKGAPKGTISKLADICDELGMTLRLSGCLAHDLGETAAGKADCTVALGLIPGEIGFANIIIKEAGGHLTEINGNEITLQSETLVAANLNLHGNIIKQISAVAS